MTRADAPDFRLLHAASYMALFCVGLYASSFGPVLPFLSDELDVSLDTAGLVLTALFIGSISASASIALVLHGQDTKRLCVAGLAASAAGMVGLGLAPNFGLALCAAVVLGVGDGLVVAAAHILMPLTSRNVPAAMNMLNLYFALGAIVGPVWSGAVLVLTDGYALVYGGIALMMALTLGAMMLARSGHDIVMGSTEAQFRAPANATTWVMGFVLFMYVGAEFGLGSWVSSYTRETANAGVMASALLASGYWGALALGRVAAAVYFRREHEATALLLASVAGAGICTLVLSLSSGDLAVAAASAFGAGLFLGPIWPAVLTIVSATTIGSSTAATVTMGNAGGIAIPWLQGRVLVGAGAAQGVAVTAALCAVMFAVVAVFRQRSGVRV